jgi:hypothetical protein
MQVYSKILNAGNYPIQTILSYNMLLDSSHAVEIQLPETLIDVIKRASPMSEKTEDGSFISLEFLPDGVLVHSSKSSGEYEEMCEFDCGLELSPLLLDVKHLLYGLGRGSVARVVEVERNGDTMRLFVIVNENSTHILIVAN